jgi:glucose/arabinose dehydrogenase
LQALAPFGLVTLVPTAHAATPGPGFGDTLVAAGLTQPTAIAFLPDGRLLVTEKGGALRLVMGGTTTTLITIPVCTTTDGTSFTEMGLLGVAVDPNFHSNGFIYLYRTQALRAAAATRSTASIRWCA